MSKLKSSLVFDEFPTIYFNDIDSLIATARSNKVATCLGIQDFSQLKKDYGADQSAVIMNITGNIISGQGRVNLRNFCPKDLEKLTRRRKVFPLTVPMHL